MILQNFCITHRLTNNKIKTLLLRTASTNVTNFIPVDLAYATYENTSPSSIAQQPPLVVLHGLFGSKSNWNSLCKAYHNKTKRKIVAVDHRNHGDSPHTNLMTYEHCVQDLKLLLERLEIKKCALLGHSMGGRTSMLFTLKYPELVEKLLVADISPFTCSPHMNVLPQYFTAMRSINLPKNIPMSDARRVADEQLTQYVKDKGLRAFLLSNLVQKGDGGFKWRINITALENNFGEITNFPTIKNAQFKGPVLFLGGGASDFIPRSDAPLIANYFPSAELKYIDGAGHWLHSEKPEEFLEFSTEFLNKTND